MKVLILMNGWLTKISGGDLHILRVAQFWNKYGIKIYYLIPELGYKYVQNRLAGDALLIHTPLEKEINSTLKIIILYLYRMLKSIFLKHKNNFDVIIASSHFLYDVIPAIILSKRYRSKLVVYVHGIYNPLYSNVIRKVNDSISSYLLNRFADLVFIVNPVISKIMNLNKDKIVSTNNGIEINYINDEAKYVSNYDACFCGRIVIEKGIYDLVSIWEKVTNVLANAKLAVIGDGPHYPLLSKRIREKFLEKNIILIGYKTGYDKVMIFKSCKLFLFPSYHESWGIVIGEAMAAGLPVICYDLPEIKPIWKDNVIWIPKGNKEEFAKKVIELLQNDKLRLEVANKAKNYVQRYNWGDVANQELKAILNLGNKI